LHTGENRGRGEGEAVESSNFHLPPSTFQLNMLGELNHTEIEALLHSQHLGKLGVTDGNMVYIVPVNYVYDGTYVIGHSTEGMKIRMMRQKPDVCFLVENILEMNQWETAIVWGRFEEITDEEEKQKAMELLWTKMLKLKVGATAIPPHASAERPRERQAGYTSVVIWRIALNKKTGRFERN
jgi:uncharacterized protein